MNVAVAPLVAKRIVGSLEVVQIHHHDRRMLHFIRPIKQPACKPIERAAVIQARQQIVIAFALKAQPLQRRGRHVFGQHDCAALDLRFFQADIPLLAIQRTNVQQRAVALLFHG